MTKDELLMKYNEALATIENQGHLAEAVSAKDEEISKLVSAHAEEISKLVSAHAEEIERIKSKHKKEFEEQEKGIKTLNAQLSERVHTLEQEQNDAGKFKEETEFYSKRYSELVIVFNSYLSFIRSHLKSLQGTLENSVEMEALLTEKLPK
jgi:hypothetical protein